MSFIQNNPERQKRGLLKRPLAFFTQRQVWLSPRGLNSQDPIQAILSTSKMILAILHVMAMAEKNTFNRIAIAIMYLGSLPNQPTNKKYASQLVHALLGT